MVPDRVPDHLGDFAGEWPLPALCGLVRENVIFEHYVVGHRHRDHDRSRVRLQRRVQQSRLRRLQLAGVAASPFDVEEEIVPLQQLRDVRLERHEIRGILRVAADRNRPGHVAVDQAHGPAEQIDARSDDGRPDAVVVEDQRLQEVIEMRLVVRDVDDAAVRGRLLRDVDVLLDPVDLAEYRVEGVLEGAVNGVTLCRAQLVEIRMNALAGLELRLPMAATQVPCDIVARQHGLGDVVEHHARTISDIINCFRVLGF